VCPMCDGLDSNGQTISSHYSEVVSRPRRTVAVVACVVAIAGLLTASSAAGGPAGRPVRVLQMNLCNSGEAGCYTGRALAAAIEVIRAHEPDLVTLNEICEDDVDALGRALAEVHQQRVVSAFQSARDGRTGEPYRCVRNGRPYGVGLLARVAEQGHTTHGEIYPAQDPDDPEQRAWLCVTTAALHACTTHLAYTSATVALAQCRHLLETAIPTLRGDLPTVLGADLNLRFGGSPDLGSCLPSGYLRVDDGGVQQVLVSDDFAVLSTRLIAMDGATDHPSLLVTLAH
jgi:hypothetical protein